MKIFDSFKNGSVLTLETNLPPRLWKKCDVVIVKVSCNPAFKGSDKELMILACNFLTQYTKKEVEFSTQYVVCYVDIDQDEHINSIIFQALTPQCVLWQ